MSVIGGLLGMLVAATSVSGASYYYEATSTETIGKGAPQTTKMRAWISGPRARLEFLGGTKRDVPEGSYLVTTDGGETVTFVNPAKKGYAHWVLDDVVRDVAERLKKEGGMVRLELSDVTRQDLVNEPSKPIHDLPTTHRKWSSGYTVKYSVLGISQVRREDTVRDVWSSDGMDVSGFDALLNPRSLQTGHEGLDKVMAAKMGDKRGFSLRSETATTIKKNNGEPETRTARTEVTLLRKEPSVDPTLFTIPSDYQERPLKKLR